MDRLLCSYSRSGRVKLKIEKNKKLEKVALDGSVECYAPPPGWRDLEL